MLLIGNSLKKSYETFKEYKQKISDDPFKPEIKKLRKELKKWTASINMIGKECPDIGDTCYKIEENAINYLSAIEGVALPCARHNLFISSKVYFYTDPKRIKEIKIQESDSFEKIYPEPKKAISGIEKVVNDCLSDSKDYGYVQDFKKRKREIINKLVLIKKNIKTPYIPGTDYSSTQKELWQTVKKMSGVEYDYRNVIRDLETQSDIKNAKTAATAIVALAIGILLGSRLKRKIG